MSIMKMKNIISQLLRGGLLCVAITAFVTSCSTDEITYATGQKPDKETLETVAGTLRSSKSLRDRVPILPKAMKMLFPIRSITGSIKRHRKH